MAIDVRGFAVVVRNAALDRLFPDGMAAYALQAPNGTYISDGNICGVSFMVYEDAQAWAERLVALGLSYSMDVAIVVQTPRCLSESPWLNVGLRSITDSDGPSVEIPLAWMADDTPGIFSPPPGWRPSTLETLNLKDLQQNYDIVNVDQRDGSGVVITYRHRVSGRMLHVGRPGVAANDLQAKCLLLRNELRRLLAMPISRSREVALGSLLNDAESLAKASDYGAWDPLFLRGVVARCLGKWALAEQSFRAVTGLHPSLLDAWLELTWALAKLDRLEEAEVSARRALEVNPRSAPAHGNLASVLLSQGRAEEALPLIIRAIELDPSDAKNQLICDRVRNALGRVEESSKAVDRSPPPADYPEMLARFFVDVVDRVESLEKRSHLLAGVVSLLLTVVTWIVHLQNPSLLQQAPFLRLVVSLIPSLGVICFGFAIFPEVAESSSDQAGGGFMSGLMSQQKSERRRKLFVLAFAVAAAN